MNMRERDFAEFSAATGHTDRRLLANLLIGRYAKRSDVMVAGDHEPIVIAGTLEMRPRVVTLLFFATPAIRRIGVSVTKAAKASIEQAFAAGAHRVECVSMAGYPEMHRWLLLLGLSPEGPAMEAWGAHKERFIPFSRVA